MLSKSALHFVFQYANTRSALKLVTGRNRIVYWHFRNISFFNHLYLLTLCSRIGLEMFIIVWLIIPSFLEPKASLNCPQYSATGPEIQQNESSPSHCVVFWHSFLCAPNLPQCSFVLFSLPKYCMCLSHFTCMLQAPPISPSLLWSLPYCNVKSTKY